MTMKIQEKLPYGVGRISAGWLGLAVAAIALIIAGIVAYSRQLADGEVITGLRDIGSGGGATWGLYIVFLIYFIGVSFGGICIAALIRLLKVQELRPIARMAELITVISILLGALVIIADLGQPLRGLFNLFLYARPGSPMFYTFTLVMSGYLFASCVFLYLAGRKDAAILAKQPGRLQGFFRLWAAGYKDTPEQIKRHRRASWWLALAILPLLVVAHSVLGFIFGNQAGQAGWFSALQAPGFVVLAGISGIGMVLMVAAVIRKVLHLEQQINIYAFRWLGNLLMVMTVVYIYFTLMEVLTARYAGPQGENVVYESLLSGEYAWAFWLAMALFVVSFFVLLTQSIARSYSIALIVLTGVLVNIAAIVKRYVIVVPSQTQGNSNILPYLDGSYSPSWVEYMVIIGLIGLGILLFSVFMKIFPIIEIPDKKSQELGGGA